MLTEYAREHAHDVVLVDTAGRMQDNEPLMRALTKLIKTNSPDLVLFVGEALVGNEAVDQLVKFNQALADHTPPGQTPRLIDGILLTKFDTIDDKVRPCDTLETWSEIVCSNLLACNYRVAGWCSHIDDVHHRPADRVRRHGADVQRLEKPECGRRREGAFEIMKCVLRRDHLLLLCANTCCDTHILLFLM
jgi:hypothetical protein